MPGTAMAGDGFSSNVAGMSKNQLYDIMCQMKALVEQNQQQAKQILVQNPNLTRALFQAQIMLGMLQPPQMIPNIQPAELQLAESLPSPRPNSQTGQSMPVQASLQDTSASQSQIPFRMQQQNQPLIPVTSRTGPRVNLQPLHMLPNVPHSVPQPKGHINVQASLTSHPQSHVPDLPTLSLHSGSQPLSPHQTQMPNSSLRTNAIQHLPTQPPLPQQPRPTSVPAFRHQLPPQMGPIMGFQHSSPQMHHSQPMFHSGAKPPQSIRSPFPQGQSALPNLPSLQSVYPAGGSQMIRDFNSAAGNSMHMERESPWLPRQPENTRPIPLPLPPPPVVPSQMAPGNQPPGQLPLSADKERALVEQVMSLTPEQINLLPPEQRNQVFQLQQMFR